MLFQHINWVQGALLPAGGAGAKSPHYYLRLFSKVGSSSFRDFQFHKAIIFGSLVHFKNFNAMGAGGWSGSVSEPWISPERTIGRTGNKTMPGTSSAMKVVRHRNRANRLMRDAIRDLELDLRGMAVLTEAASGVFAVTSLIAALAGADAVFAVTRDSDHGSAKEVLEYVRGWATELEVAHALTISTEPAGNFAHKANIVTNLGFVRPIDRDLVTKLPVDSAVSLMWEPWELREEDINLQACHERNIPVLGTWEGHKRLRIFDYLGTLVLKLMFQAEIEVTGARIIMVASEPFGSAARHAIEGAGVFVNVVDPTESRQSSGVGIRESHLAGIDAMVLLEHRYPGVLVGAEGLVHPRALAERGIPLIHICGNVDGDDLVGSGIIKIPEHIVPPGYMTVTTAEVGPRPVIDLHTAGLKVAQAMVEELRRGGNAASAKSAAIAMGLGMDFESRETS